LLKQKIKSIDCFDTVLYVVWADGKEDCYSLRALRLCCPCAFCSGEKDVFNNQYGGEKRPLPDTAFQLSSYSFIGLYGLKFVWKDGHSDGIYTGKLLEGLRETNK